MIPWDASSHSPLVFTLPRAQQRLHPSAVPWSVVVPPDRMLWACRSLWESTSCLMMELWVVLLVLVDSLPGKANTCWPGIFSQVLVSRGAISRERPAFCPMQGAA